MIAFDNGPKDGDFVRYIDTLLANRVSAPTATPKHDLVDDAAPSSMDSAATRSPALANRALAARPPRAPRPPSAPITPAQANEMADALLARSGKVGRHASGLPVAPSVLTPAVVPIVAAIAGAVLVVLSSGTVALLGMGLVVWAIATFIKRVAAMRTQWTSLATDRDAREAARVASVDWKNVGTRREP